MTRSERTFLSLALLFLDIGALAFAFVAAWQHFAGGLVAGLFFCALFTALGAAIDDVEE